jgi:putative membrane protein
MMYSGHWMGTAWILITLTVVLSTLVLAFVLPARGQRPPSAPPAPDAERVLADRFARGEIDAEEYEQRLHTLRAART